MHNIFIMVIIVTLHLTTTELQNKQMTHNLHDFLLCLSEVYLNIKSLPK